MTERVHQPPDWRHDGGRKPTSTSSDERLLAKIAARQEFLGRLRGALVQAINGQPITVADAWDILREWDKATGTRGDIPNFPEAHSGS